MSYLFDDDDDGVVQGIPSGFRLAPSGAPGTGMTVAELDALLGPARDRVQVGILGVADAFNREVASVLNQASQPTVAMVDLGSVLSRVQASFVPGALLLVSSIDRILDGPIVRVRRDAHSGMPIPDEAAIEAAGLAPRAERMAFDYATIRSVASMALQAIRRGDEAMALDLAGKIAALVP